LLIVLLLARGDAPCRGVAVSDAANEPSSDRDAKAAESAPSGGAGGSGGSGAECALAPYESCTAPDTVLRALEGCEAGARMGPVLMRVSCRAPPSAPYAASI